MDPKLLFLAIAASAGSPSRKRLLQSPWYRQESLRQGNQEGLPEIGFAAASGQEQESRRRGEVQRNRRRYLTPVGLPFTKY